LASNSSRRCASCHLTNLILGHDVHHAREMGWERLTNRKLLTAAEREGFQVLVTVDKNVRFEPNFAKRLISLVTLNPRLVDFDHIAPLAGRLRELLEQGLPPGSEIVIEP
jgi:hypothetical protein